MSRYKKRVTTLEKTNMQRRDLMTIREAAKLLDVTVATISQRANRGTLTVIVDTEAPRHQGRRLLVKSEIERLRK